MVLFETPMLFSTQSIVTGNVAPDELVEKAAAMAGACHGGEHLNTAWSKIVSNANPQMDIQELAEKFCKTVRWQAELSKPG